MRFLLPLLFFSLLNAEEDFERFKKEQLLQQQRESDAFTQYEKEQNDAFTQYQEALQKAYESYRGELSHYWDDPELSSAKVWVSYTPDMLSRSRIDFENNTMVIETVAERDDVARLKIEALYKERLTATTQSAFIKDPLQQRLSKVTRPKSVVTAPVDSKPILSTTVFDKQPTPAEIDQYVAQHVTPNVLEKKPDPKNPKQLIYALHVTLPSDIMLKRSRLYESEIRTNASKFHIPVPLIFAVIHTESSYNPFATSHIPAYGLMQIVPKSAGIDTYAFLHGQKRQPSAEYLYNAGNNIEMGSAYLHILYFRYLKEVTSPLSRLYCAIAAYNTGAGNVAWAFTKTHNVSQAASLINAMQPEDVYRHLQQNLRYDEPKVYLERVRNRMAAYHRIYKS